MAPTGSNAMWRDLLPSLIETAARGDADSIAELQRLADFADGARQQEVKHRAQIVELRDATAFALGKIVSARAGGEFRSPHTLANVERRLQLLIKQAPDTTDDFAAAVRQCGITVRQTDDGYEFLAPLVRRDYFLRHEPQAGPESPWILEEFDTDMHTGREAHIEPRSHSDILTAITEIFKRVHDAALTLHPRHNEVPLPAAKPQQPGRSKH